MVEPMLISHFNFFLLYVFIHYFGKKKQINEIFKSGAEVKKMNDVFKQYKPAHPKTYVYRNKNNFLTVRYPFNLFFTLLIIRIEARYKQHTFIHIYGYIEFLV